MGIRTTSLLVLALALVASLGETAAGAEAVAAAPAPEASAQPASCLRDVMPLLSKRGCNAAQCHGASLGKGALRLSMFGAEPDADYDALTKMHQGRRINRVEPAKSLLLLKTTNAVAHTGGAVVAPDSPEYAMLVAWVAQGVPYGDDKLHRPVALKVSPKDKAMAKAEVFGEAVVSATFMRRFDTVRVLSAQPLPTPFPAVVANNKIDELVFAKLQKLGFPPSDVCSDEVFLRRVYLDVIGTLPKPDEARAFLADPDPAKRTKLIDRLLERDEYADFWALKWGDLLRIKSEYPVRGWPLGVQTYHNWVRNSIAA